MLLTVLVLHRYYTNEFGAPLYSFGWGLSLTSWELHCSTCGNTDAVSTSKNSSLTVSIKNTGSREGDQVVLLFWAKVGKANLPPTMPVPNQKLVAFKRVSNVQAGTSATVTFTVSAEELSLFDENGDTIVFEGTHQLRASIGSGCAPEQSFIVKKRETLRTLEWYAPDELAGKRPATLKSDDAIADTPWSWGTMSTFVHCLNKSGDSEERRCNCRHAVVLGHDVDLRALLEQVRRPEQQDLGAHGII